MKHTNTIEKKNYNGIDLMKFICIFFIISIHTSPFPVDTSSMIFKYMNFYFKNTIGRVAVPLFFVASSFLLFRKMKENLDFEVFKKYIKRLFSLYLIWTAVYLPLIIEKIINAESIGVGITNFLKKFIFDGSYLHLWYLPSLIVAISILYFLLKKKVNIKNIIIIAIVLYVLGLLAQSWFGIIRPLKTISPFIWNILLKVKEVIFTTRNGLFEGFIFVVLGYLFATKEFNLNIKKNIIGIMVFAGVLVIEASALKLLNITRLYDMYLSLIPLSFFIFNF